MDPASLILIVVAAWFVHWATKSKKGKRKRGKTKRVKASWYWGNKKWNAIRARRKEENRTRYNLPKGTCRCERCAKKITGKNIHCDHIYPRKPYWFLQYCYWNTQILCGTCNTKKSNKTDGHNWRRLRQWRLHPIAWLLKKRQEVKGIR